MIVSSTLSSYEFQTGWYFRVWCAWCFAELLPVNLVSVGWTRRAPFNMFLKNALDKYEPYKSYLNRAAASDVRPDHYEIYIWVPLGTTIHIHKSTPRVRISKSTRYKLPATFLSKASNGRLSQTNLYNRSSLAYTAFKSVMNFA